MIRIIPSYLLEEQKIAQYTISPDPRERYNRETEVLRIKHSEHKLGKFTLNFKDAEEHTDELGSFFIIRGPDLAQLLDLDKVDQNFVAGPSLDDAIAETFNESFPSFIGVETVPLSSSMELRYRILDGRVTFALTYPISLQSHNITPLGKTLDIFGSRRCVDDCCTEFQYDPPVVSRELPANLASDPDATITCSLGGEGVDGSIQDEDGRNAGWEHFRHTAFLQNAANHIPESYNIRSFSLAAWSRTVGCSDFISALESLFTYDTLRRVIFNIDWQQYISAYENRELWGRWAGRISRMGFPDTTCSIGRPSIANTWGNELCPAAYSDPPVYIAYDLPLPSIRVET